MTDGQIKKRIVELENLISLAKKELDSSLMSKGFITALELEKTSLKNLL